jgi:multidrug efflux pump subunit AcrA (membrane-fusion protein)
MPFRLLISRNAPRLLPFVFVATLAGCNQHAAPPAAGGMQAMPVMVQPISNSAVPASDTYVATIKSRRSATMQPQVDGNLTRILVHSGQSVKAGQLLMTIDPLKQQATVQQQQGTEAQKKAVLDYNRIEENRQRQLLDAGVISRDAYDQALQSLQNSQGDYGSATAQTQTQREQLA